MTMMKQLPSIQTGATQNQLFHQKAWFDFAKALICGSIGTHNPLFVYHRELP
jgi:hypothetical protein